MKYYHGGRPALRKGMFILPRSLTGAVPCVSRFNGDLRGECRPDRVYLCAKFEGALIFAATHPSGRAFVYEVEPVGAIEPETDTRQPGLSFQCERAKIVKAFRIGPATRNAVLNAVFGKPPA